MTSDEFGSKYQLHKQIASEGGRSFTAEHRESGQHVLVHYLDEGSDLAGASLADLLAGLRARDRSRVYEVLTVDGTLVVVTEVLEGFGGLGAWLHAHAGETQRPQPDAPSPPNAVRGGEFTQLFRPPDEPLAGPFASGLSPLPDAASGPRRPQGRDDPVAGPPEGNFTELFRKPAGADAPPGPPGATNVPPVPLLSVRVGPLSPPPSRPPILTPRLGGEPGRPNLSQAPAAPPRMAAPKLEPVESAAASAPPIGWAGPSDFTRQLNREAEPPTTEPAASETPTAAPEAGRKSMLVPLLLALNLIVVVAVGLIVYFALKRC